MKLFKNLSFIIFTFLVFNAFGQEESNGLVRQVNLSILYPGVSAEMPLSSNFSMVGKLGLGGGFGASASTNGQSNFDYFVAPVYGIQGRFYYNGVKSETRKGKALFANSGNYAFLQVAGNFNAIATSFPTSGSTASLNAGLGWGLQRIYQNKFLISWGIGLGYYSIGQISAIGEFTLGINLFTN